MDKVFLDRKKPLGFLEWRDLVQRLLSQYEVIIKKRICEANFYYSAHHAVAVGVKRVKGPGERE